MVFQGEWPAIGDDGDVPHTPVRSSKDWMQHEVIGGKDQTGVAFALEIYKLDEMTRRRNGTHATLFRKLPKHLSSRLLTSARALFSL